MCGFFGFVGSGLPVDMDAGAARVRRRGPDSLGLWSSKNQRVRLAHARLAISDLRPAAAQPISDAESGITIGFVGEIYNHRDLRKDFPPDTFRTDSDTETLLTLINTYGLEATLPKLRGMFALVVVDEKQGTVTLTRDPVGKKPLFVLPRPEGIYFGSSVLALAAGSGFKEIDTDAATAWWEQGFCPPTLSVLRGCYPLKPGEVQKLSIEGKVIHTQRITPVELEPITRISLPEAKEEVGRILRLAVRRRLSDNPNPVALLSGGIDSTVVCKMAIEEGATRLLTLGSRWFRTADQKYAVEAARRLGVSLEIIELGPEPIDVRTERMVQLQDEPLGMISFVPLGSLAREASRGARVLLTGDGGDETFGGYGKPADWVRGESESVGGEFQSGPRYPEWMSGYGRRAAGYDQVGHGFAKLDRATAEQAVEARCPMLSWDLVAFARALPQNIFFHSAVAKPMAKAMLDGWPQAFLERKKAGFTFHMRWQWAMRGFSGLRESIREEVVDLFLQHLPEPLTGNPKEWTSLGIFQHFEVVYRLYVWSAYLSRLETAPVAEAPISVVGMNDRFPSADQLVELKEAGFTGHQLNAVSVLQALAALGCKPENTRVVDLECGWGARSYQLMKAGYRVTGVEGDAAARGFAVSQMGVEVKSSLTELEGQVDVIITPKAPLPSLPAGLKSSWVLLLNADAASFNGAVLDGMPKDIVAVRG
jgi:asparagine synthase (glutamine-hydrolysing)